MPFPGRAPVFTVGLRRQGSALRFLSLRRSDKSIGDPPDGGRFCFCCRTCCRILAPTPQRDMARWVFRYGLPAPQACGTGADKENRAWPDSCDRGKPIPEFVDPGLDQMGHPPTLYHLPSMKAPGKHSGCAFVDFAFGNCGPKNGG